MYRLTLTRTINAPKSVIWPIISDLAGYGNYAPNLSKAIQTSDGDNPSRRCWDTKNRGWNEACSFWDEGNEYSMIVDTTDYPYPYNFVKGTWGVREVNNQSEIYMHFDYAPDKSGVLGWLIHRVTKRAFPPIVEELFDNWQNTIEQRHS